MNPNERQVAGGHYKSSYQHWDYVRLALDSRYLEGCLSKYVYRWRKKNGLQDLLKAQHYYEKILDLYRAGVYDAPAGNEEAFHEALGFAGTNGFDAFRSDEGRILVILCGWASEQDLLVVGTLLNALVAKAQAEGL